MTLSIVPLCNSHEYGECSVSSSRRVASGNVDFREFLRETLHGLHHSVVNKLFGMSQMITVNFFSECFMSRVKGFTQ